jgi:hypothetical protein
VVGRHDAPLPDGTGHLFAFAAMFAATFLASTSSIFIVTVLALHVYHLTGHQTLAALVPVTQWAAAVPCVFAVASLSRRLTPKRLMAFMWISMGAASMLSHVVVDAVWPLLALLCIRGSADFLAKNARAQWLKGMIEGRTNPQRYGSLIATSQYMGTFMGGLTALAVAGNWGVHNALNLDALLCTCAALLTIPASRDVKEATDGGAQPAGTGWAALFGMLRQRSDLGWLFVALIGFSGLFQGYHQAAKVGMSGALPPLIPDSVPGILQVAAGLGIVLGAITGSVRAMYGSARPIVICLVGAVASMLGAVAMAHATAWGALVAYFGMMLLFEVGFTLANNQLLIALPRAQVPAMHSSSYVLSCAAMIATSLISAAAFERLPLITAAAAVVLASGTVYALMAIAIRRTEVTVVSSDVR